MERIYQNFDALDVAFQGAFPTQALKILETAKNEAQKVKKPASAYLGKNSIPVMVGETGAKGGFAYVFNTGIAGQIWSVSRSKDTTRWNIFISISSQGLALNGYHKTKDKIYELLEDFEVIPPSTPQNGQLYTRPVASISRVDFCIDFKTDLFEPCYQNFIGCGAKKKKIIGTEIPFFADSNGKTIETLTMGKLPNKQVTLYNKTKEVRTKNSTKHYWWKIWNIDKDSFNQEIWRVEVRAGKTELRNWKVRSFESLERQCHEIISSILGKYRYTNPNPNDTNRARWENETFWDCAIKATTTALGTYHCNVTESELQDDILNKKRAFYMNNIVGNIISLTAINELEPDKIINTIDDVRVFLGDCLGNEDDMQSIATRHKKAKERFSLLHKP